jgi:hypothetical protein
LISGFDALLEKLGWRYFDEVWQEDNNPEYGRLPCALRHNIRDQHLAIGLSQ